MKLIFTKKTLLLIILAGMLSICQQGYTQTIFYDDFGNSITRVRTPYMPTGSYKYADPTLYSTSTDIDDAKSINDNFYAVIPPTHIVDITTNWNVGNCYYFWTKVTSSGSTTPSGYKDYYTTDHTGTNGTSGAVLVVNAGTTLNFFYNRPVTLTNGNCYRLSFWLYLVAENSQIQVKVNSVKTNTNLASYLFAVAGTSYLGKWTQFTVDFTVPASCSSTTSDIIVALGNAYSLIDGNDYYIDDIKLEQVACASPVNISCTTEKLPAIKYGQLCTAETNAQAVKITDDPGAGTYSSTPVGLSLNSSTGAITPSTSTVGTYTVTYTVPPTANCGTITASTTATITTCANLSVTKTVDIAHPAVGDQVTFTITATNNGPSAATGVKVTDLLPVGYTFVSATLPTGTTYNSGTWTIGNLSKDTSAILILKAKVF